MYEGSLLRAAGIILIFTLLIGACIWVYWYPFPSENDTAPAYSVEENVTIETPKYTIEAESVVIENIEYVDTIVVNEQDKFDEEVQPFLSEETITAIKNIAGFIVGLFIGGAIFQIIKVFILERS